MSNPTSESVGRLRAEKPREFDALVAMHLHGWRWWKFTGTADKPRSKSLYQFLNPADSGWAGDDYFRGVHVDAPGADGGTMGDSQPRYAAGPAADYATLSRVRETWTTAQLVALKDVLYDMWLERGAKFLDRIAYQPGDYSHAALQVALAPSGAGGASGGTR